MTKFQCFRAMHIFTLNNKLLTPSFERFRVVCLLLCYTPELHLPLSYQFIEGDSYFFFVFCNFLRRLNKYFVFARSIIGSRTTYARNSSLLLRKTKKLWGKTVTVDADVYKAFPVNSYEVTKNSTTTSVDRTKNNRVIPHGHGFGNFHSHRNLFFHVKVRKSL